MPTSIIYKIVKKKGAILLIPLSMMHPLVPESIELMDKPAISPCLPRRYTNVRSEQG
jgi:hypothetical protein